MLNRPRAMALTVACCTVAVIGAPSVALAHRGHDHFGRFVSHAKQVRYACAEAGVAFNGHAHWGLEGRALSSLTETQVNELKAACEKLAAAYAVKRTADEAAGKALWEALKAARTKLDEACPALTEHHGPGLWWADDELSPACQEALKAYWTSAHEAKKTFRAAIEAACKPYEAALTEFESSTGSILAALEAADAEHSFGRSNGFDRHGSRQGFDGHGAAQGSSDPGSQGSCHH